MENASKALIIAASILIAILIISLGVRIFNGAQSAANGTQLDETEINIYINKVSEEINLKGLFLKELLKDEADGKIDKNIVEKIIEIGLDVLK